MTIREIFIAISNVFTKFLNAISKAFNAFIDADIFMMIGFLVFFVGGPYTIYKLFKSPKQPGGMIFGTIISLVIIYFFIILIKGFSEI